MFNAVLIISFLKDVLSFYQNDRTFMIVGYSFGALLALKIIHKLESLGKTGKLIVIDAAPLHSSAITRRVLPANFTDNDIQAIVIYHFAKPIFGFKSIVDEILAFDTWDSRIDALIELGKDRSSYNPEFAKKNVTSIVNKIRMLTNVDESTFPSLQSTSIELIKALTSSMKAEKEDYGLSQYSAKTINVQVMEGDHASILVNPEIVQFLNSL